MFSVPEVRGTELHGVISPDLRCIPKEGAIFIKVAVGTEGCRTVQECAREGDVWYAAESFAKRKAFENSPP